MIETGSKVTLVVSYGKYGSPFVGGYTYTVESVGDNGVMYVIGEDGFSRPCFFPCDTYGRWELED